MVSIFFDRFSQSNPRIIRLVLVLVVSRSMNRKGILSARLKEFQSKWASKLSAQVVMLSALTLRGIPKLSPDVERMIGAHAIAPAFGRTSRAKRV